MKQNIIIRQATEEDLTSIARIIKDIWGMGLDATLEARYGPIGGRRWQEWCSEKIIQSLKGLCASSATSGQKGLFFNKVL